MARSLQKQLLVAVLGSLTALSAEAALVTYSNQAQFVAATGATSATGALPVVQAPLAARTVGSVTFTAPNFLLGYDGFSAPIDWSTRISGNDLAVSVGTGDTTTNDGIDVSFAAPVFAAGFEFHEPLEFNGVLDGCNSSPCIDSTFTVSLRDGASTVGTFTFNAPNDILAFVGVASDTAFDRMLIRETVGTDDNEFYGQFYTAVTPVPGPAAGLLLATGCAAMGAAARRRRNSRR